MNTLDTAIFHWIDHVTRQRDELLGIVDSDVAERIREDKMTVTLDPLDGYSVKYRHLQGVELLRALTEHRDEFKF